MASTADGPYASTRSRTTVVLEQPPDPRGKSQPQASTTFNATTPNDTAANHVECRLNAHDCRLEGLEELNETLCTIVMRIEECLQPSSECQEQVIGAVKQLQQLDRRLQPGGSANLSLQKMTQFDSRLRQVEKTTDLIADQPTSTHELALSLISRLKGGDILDESANMTLRLHLGGSEIYPSSESNTDMQWATPVPKASEVVDQPIEPSFAQPRGIIKPATRKRRRISNTQGDLGSIRRVRFESADLRPDGVDEALNIFQAGLFSNQDR
ncbi:hypothetical protein LTR56_027881, partial [Elasticomyces elasticus]